MNSALEMNLIRIGYSLAAPGFYTAAWGLSVTIEKGAAEGQLSITPGVRSIFDDSSILATWTCDFDENKNIAVTRQMGCDFVKYNLNVTVEAERYYRLYTHETTLENVRRLADLREDGWFIFKKKRRIPISNLLTACIYFHKGELEPSRHYAREYLELTRKTRTVEEQNDLINKVSKHLGI